MLRLKEAVSLGFMFESIYLYLCVGVVFSQLKMAKKAGFLSNMNAFLIYVTRVVARIIPIEIVICGLRAMAL